MTSDAETYNRCVSHIRNNEFEAALEVGLTVSTTFPYIHLALGTALAGLHRYPEAVDAFLDDLGVNPQSMVTHANLGNAFEQLGMYVEAFDAAETALLLGADRSSTLSNMVYQAARICDWPRQRSAQARLDAHLARGGENRMEPFQSFVAGATRAQQHEAAKSHFKKHWGHIVPMEAPHGK